MMVAQRILGNTILVKLKLWELVIVLIKHFGLPLTYAYATLRQSVAGNSPFRGIVFCNLVTSKTVIKIRHHARYCYPIFPHMVTPTMFPWDKKTRGDKKVLFNYVLIPWYPVSYLTIASSGFFFLGAYGSLPDAAIWWCLRTGGGGVLTRLNHKSERNTHNLSKNGVTPYFKVQYGPWVLCFQP
jgi:hypothetical protein